MLTKTITLTKGEHRKVPVIFIEFNYNKEIINLCKQLKARWSNTNKKWYVDANLFNLNSWFEAFKGTAWVNYSSIKGFSTNIKAVKTPPIKREQPIKNFSTEVKKEIAAFADILGAKGYATNTRATYKNMIEVFFGYFTHKSPGEITNEDINSFINELNVGRGYSASYLRLMIGAIRLFYAKRKKRALDIDLIDLPKRRRQLPKVLSLEEVNSILDQIKNLKHLTMISLQYGCGLRVSELLALKAEHFNKDRNTVLILNSKGSVDRRIKVSDSIIKMLREYWKAYRPEDYLFEGQAGGKYSDRSVNQILKRAATKAGIKRHISSHMLRHSYATHLLEGGVDLRYIQELLGHKSSKTTEIYTYVSNHKLETLPSPFDFLKRNEK
ncbi:MAG: integrase [Crocinitomicaceae bacterium]|nr:integrase [Crocinitomicaceae bacterium]|tara:strand:- start:19547 stop:20695 length:1149 start_codon:yes stop_codon:yes gene_type:complete